MSVETSVLDRYSEGAKTVQADLCCPVNYDPALLALLPSEIIEKDYGCGDPSRYVRPGDTVLDLGSGAGKICYMAAQLVGPEGKVIGVDMNDDMLALARKYQDEMALKLGGQRVEFRKGQIQDLALDVELLERYLRDHPVRDVADLRALEDWQARLRGEAPMIADASVDLVVSNCVLNLVRDEQKLQLIREIARVVKPGGRIAISDIVCDEPVPADLKADLALWSGCISGAFEEEAFLQNFVDQGFVAVTIDQWGIEPWQVVSGIEFRAVTVTGVKSVGKECLDRGHAVIYRGPYSEIRDEEGHIFPRGVRVAVCERTYKFVTEGPYRSDFIGVSPSVLAEPVTWCAPAGTRRSPKVTKGGMQTAVCDTPGCC